MTAHMSGMPSWLASGVPRRRRTVWGPAGRGGVRLGRGRILGHRRGPARDRPTRHRRPGRRLAPPLRFPRPVRRGRQQPARARRPAKVVVQLGRSAPRVRGRCRRSAGAGRRQRQRHRGQRRHRHHRAVRIVRTVSLQGTTVGAAAGSASSVRSPCRVACGSVSVRRGSRRLLPAHRGRRKINRSRGMLQLRRAGAACIFRA